MSVTFFHTAEPVISGWTLTCGCGEGPRFDDRDDAVAAIGKYREAATWSYCDDELCAADIPMISPEYVGVEPLSVNLSNVNARHILGLVGANTTDELWGEMSPAAFAAALAMAEPTSGIPTLVSVAVAGEMVELAADQVPADAPVRAVYCGRDETYDVRKLAALGALVAQAQEWHAESICWS